VSQGMLHIDKILLAILLFRIYLRCSGKNTFEQEFDFLFLQSSKLQIGDGASRTAKQLSIPPLNEHQILAIQSLANLPPFKDCIDKLKAISTKELSEWIESDKPELCVPAIWKQGKPCKHFLHERFYCLRTKLRIFIAEIEKSVDEFLLISILRPDRLLASSHMLISAAFGHDFMQQDNVINLREVIQNEVKNN
jgi:hypothetical protein